MILVSLTKYLGGIDLKIESNGEEKITVTLSHIDMADLDITYDEMDYSNIETRRVIWTILDKAKKTLGKSVDTDGKLLIEVAPAADGGCILHFTSSACTDTKSKKRLIMKKEAEPILFCPWDENAFLDSLHLMENLKNSIKTAERYKYNDKLYIIVRPQITFSEKLLHILCEFGDTSVFTECEISKIYEYGTALS